VKKKKERKTRSIAKIKESEKEERKKNPFHSLLVPTATILC